MKIFHFILLALFCGNLLAQETYPTVPPMGSTMPRMNPAMLMKMRDQLTFELQQTQRTLGFIDPNDTQLSATLKEQQKELLAQLKEIGTQLKAQGIPGVAGEMDTEPAEAKPQVSPTVVEPTIKPIPKQDDPTLVPGGMPQPASANYDRVLQQRLQELQNRMQPGMQTGLPMPSPVPMAQPGMSPVGPPSDFDQDQALANSPWAPKPSKELIELKQTVDSLRKELGEMRETIKALETQIQLLNRNILLSQPAK